MDSKGSLVGSSYRKNLQLDMISPNLGDPGLDVVEWRHSNFQTTISFLDPVFTSLGYCPLEEPIREANWVSIHCRG